MTACRHHIKAYEVFIADLVFKMINSVAIYVTWVMPQWPILYEFAKKNVILGWLWCGLIKNAKTTEKLIIV